MGADQDADVLLRNDQLSLKAGRKKTRKEKTNAKKKKNNSKKKGAKKNNKRGKTSNGRSVLQRAASKRKQVIKGDDTYETEEGTSPAKSSKPLKARKSKQDSDCSKSAPSSSSKAKSTKTAPKKEPTSRLAPKAKAKAKVKASPKPKAKAKGRKRQEPTPNIEKADSDMVETIKQYVSMFGEDDVVTSAGFKKDIKATPDLVILEHHRLNIYWSRCSCGVSSRALGKDIFHVSYNGAYGGSWASDSYKLATSVKVCELLAAY